MSQIIILVTNDKNLEDKEMSLFIMEQFKKIIKTKYDYVLYKNDYNNSKFELGALKDVYKDFDYDELFVLQDSIEIKDITVFDKIFEEHKGRSVFCNPKGQMYLNKYRKEGLDKLEISVPTNKKESIQYEHEFNDKYKKLDTPIILFPDFVDTDKKEIRFGRNNMIIENEYFKKYKGCWDEKMIKDDKN